MVAFLSVLLFGILTGVLLAVLASLILLIRRISYPHVALLGRIGNSEHYSDMERHADNILIDDIIILRVESSILYFNAEDALQKINNNIENYAGNLELVILDLSASPFIDVEGSKMLLQLSNQLKRKGIGLKVVEALSSVRDIMRKQGMEEVIGHISRKISIDDAVHEFETSKS